MREAHSPPEKEGLANPDEGENQQKANRNTSKVSKWNF